MVRDYARLLRLLKEGHSISEIAEAMHIKRDTVAAARDRIIMAYGSLEAVPDGQTDEDIHAWIVRLRNSGHLPVDCDMVLRQHRNGKTYDELWTAYVKDAEARSLRHYGRSSFCSTVAEYARVHDMTVGIEKRPGFKCEVDWVGDKAAITDPDAGEPVPIHIFVMALPYSGYFYCEGFLNEKMDSWLTGHIHGFNYFGGVPVMIVPDNCKTAVVEGRRNFRDEAVLNPRYKDLADHYGAFIRPARVRRPKDKSVVERSVQIIEKDIMTEMARLDMFSLEEFNRILARKLERRLARPYTKRYGSRTSIFEEEEKDTLHPLPATGFNSCREREAAVGRDGYIQYCNAYYSVPPRYIKKKVIVREIDGVLSIYDDARNLIAEHGKAVRKWQRVSVPEHQKHDLALYGGYSSNEFDDSARSIGPSMHSWVRTVKARHDNAADSYRTLLGVFSFIRKFPADLVEKAAADALRVGVCSARGFKAFISDHMAEQEKDDARGSSIDDIYISHEKEVSEWR